MKCNSCDRTFIFLSHETECIICDKVFCPWCSVQIDEIFSNPDVYIPLEDRYYYVCKKCEEENRDKIEFLESVILDSFNNIKELIEGMKNGKS